MTIKQALIYGICVFWCLVCAGFGCKAFHEISRDARADTIAVFKVVKGR